MLAKLIGVLSIARGIFCLTRPEYLRDRFIWKTGRYFFWLVMVFLFFPMAHFFGKKAGFAGIFFTLAVIWVGFKTMRATLKTLFARIPLAAFQAIGFLSIVSGASLIWWPKN